MSGTVEQPEADRPARDYSQLATALKVLAFWLAGVIVGTVVGNLVIGSHAGRWLGPAIGLGLGVAAWSFMSRNNQQPHHD